MSAYAIILMDGDPATACCVYSKDGLEKDLELRKETLGNHEVYTLAFVQSVAAEITVKCFTPSKQDEPSRGS